MTVLLAQEFSVLLWKGVFLSQLQTVFDNSKEMFTYQDS